jgi:serine/threonine protein kinase/formylglycine-generating enzyme required for sulfatase activity
MTDESLFAAALERPTPEARAEFVSSACDGPDQLARLESLLAAHDRAGRFLDRPAVAADSDGDVTRSTAPDEAVTRTVDSLSGDPADDDATSFLAPAGRPDSLGRIGHYEVLEVLGRGGFGIVYRAFDDKLQRVVAVKVLAPHMAVTSPARKRFLREARSAAAVRHENVVLIHAVEEQPLPHLVMEYIPGETLQERLDRTGPLDPPEALRIGRQIADGLAAAHAQGLIHRDIKPSNILIDAGPAAAAKITDFGLARAADDASLTRSGVVAGTPMYMAPEQARGETLDHRADLFSLGSVLYVMLSGRPPFRANSTPAVLKRVADDTPRPIREVIPEVPEWFTRIVDKLHAKNPAERFQTARDVADLLADCEKQLAERKELTDFTRIPGGKPAIRRWSRRRVQVVGGLLAFVSLLYIALWVARPAWLAATDRGTLEILQGDGLVSVIVLQNDEGDLVTDKLHTPVTDWLGMKEKSHTLTLPPGKYQLNVGTYPAGTEVGQWEVTTADLFSRRTVEVPVIRTSAIIPVGRGERVTVRPKMIQRPLPPAPPPPPSVDEFTPLFNGKDLTGWKTLAEQPGNWRVEDGVLVGRGTAAADSMSFLATDREYSDFHLWVEGRVRSAVANSGVLFRSDGVRVDNCFEADIDFDRATSTSRVGELFIPGRLVSARSDVRADEWFVLEVIARGDQVATLVNGHPVAEARGVGGRPRGKILLQQYKANAVVEFRKIEIKELMASTAAKPDGFTPLFNGKDLTGWKTHPDAPGKWVVDEGALTFGGVGRLVLFSERGDYGDFRLRAEVKFGKLGGGLLWVRRPFEIEAPNTGVIGHAVTLGRAKDDPQLGPRKTGSLLKLTANPDDPIAPAPEGWHTVEVEARGNRLQVFVNGQKTADYEDKENKWPRGHIALANTQENQSQVYFRKIEIKDLSAGSPEVPKRTADFLPFVRGTWSRDGEIVEPKAEAARVGGQVAFDHAAGGTVLRGLHVDEHATPTSLILHKYDAKTDKLSSWYFSSDGMATASESGLYDPTDRDFLWWEDLPGGGRSTHKLKVEDANTVTAKHYDTDAAGKFVFEAKGTFTRSTLPPVVPKVVIDPKRPAEAAVLDRLVGEWRAEITVKPASAVELWRTTARPLLGGRFVEMTGTNDAGVASDYAVVWYDPTAKLYRQWYFNSDGQAFPMTGAWDTASNTLSWETADKTKTGRWIFKGDGWDFRRAITDGKGKVLSEATGESRRVVALKNTNNELPAVKASDPVWLQEPGHEEAAGGQVTQTGYWAFENEAREWQIHYPRPFRDPPKLTVTQFHQGTIDFAVTDEKPTGFKIRLNSAAHKNGDFPTVRWNAVGTPARPKETPTEHNGTLALNRRGDFKVTFPRAYAHPPHLRLKVADGTADYEFTEQTESGFKILVRRVGEGAATPARLEWRALGVFPPPAVAPFDDKEAKAHQEAWAKHLNTPVEFTNSAGMTFRLIPPGRFVMGSPDAEPGRNAEREGPPHPVAVDAPFHLGVFEVTQGQYQAIAGEDPKRPRPTKDHPVSSVSLEEAVEFCRLLSETADEKKAGRVYRLPTEAEWEYACRAGTTTAYSFGDNPAKLDEYAWTKTTATGPRSVGRLKANPWGLFDLHGNVFEMCGDRRDYVAGKSESPPPVIARGGSWQKTAADARSAYRGLNLVKSRYADVGFRVVCEVGKK